MSKTLKNLRKMMNVLNILLILGTAVDTEKTSTAHNTKIFFLLLPFCTFGCALIAATIPEIKPKNA